MLVHRYVVQLRTQENYKKFFRGLPERRMRTLLENAYDGLKEKERRKKVSKRLALLEGLLR